MMHLAAQPVDDEHVAVADVLGDVLERHHARDLERARQDRRVRGLAADVGAEGRRTAARCRCAVSAGDRSCATMTAPGGGIAGPASTPSRLRRMRSPTKSMSRAPLAEVVLLDGVEDRLDLLDGACAAPTRR